MAKVAKKTARRTRQSIDEKPRITAAKGDCPIGAIIPFIGQLKGLGPEWVVCDGRTIKDSGSPMNGMELPNLTDDRFLMGVGAMAKAGIPGGENQINDEGGVAARSIPSGLADSAAGYTDLPGGNVYVTSNAHRHSIDIPGLPPHNHGGDKRPRFCTVWYICRIK